VKDQDQTDMVMHLNRVMADKDLRRRLRGNINGSLSKFSLDEVAEEWEKLFRRIL